MKRTERRGYNDAMRIKTGQIGMSAFGAGIVITALMIWMGVSGHSWPHWLIALTTIL
jgi:hypothetical protein